MGRARRRHSFFATAIAAASVFAAAADCAFAARAHAMRWTSRAYLTRYVTWGPVFLSRKLRGVNPLHDGHEWCPVRPIRNAESVHQFPARDRFTMPSRIEVRDGDLRTAHDLDVFLASTGTTALIVLKDGELVAERYYNGHRRDSLSASQSIATSVTSALIGIAIAEGAIGAVEDSIRKYLPDLDAQTFDPVTVRHLLTMTSGLSYARGALPWHHDQLFTYAHDLQAVAAAAETREPPGRSFDHNDLNTVLLGMVLAAATGRTPSAYLEERLWRPLGMEYPASWCLDSEGAGFELTADGLNARAVDYAKLGQLYLGEGVWRGRRILPRDWVLDSTSREQAAALPWRAHSPWHAAGARYGYHWWGLTDERGHDAFTAVGDYGQFVYVHPATRVVIVRTGNRWGVPLSTWPGVLRTIAAGVVPTARSRAGAGSRIDLTPAAAQRSATW